MGAQLWILQALPGPEVAKTVLSSPPNPQHTIIHYFSNPCRNISKEATAFHATVPEGVRSAAPQWPLVAAPGCSAEQDSFLSFTSGLSYFPSDPRRKGVEFTILCRLMAGPASAFHRLCQAPYHQKPINAKPSLVQAWCCPVRISNIVLCLGRLNPG